MQTEYQLPSLLPWQAPRHVHWSTFAYKLHLDSGGPQSRPLATLTMYHHEGSAHPFTWMIMLDIDGARPVVSRTPGYKQYRHAERTMLRALAALLHPDQKLPAYLPPRRGSISTRRQGR